jgi:hypothetical protein
MASLLECIMSAGDSTDLKVKIVRKLASNEVTGDHKKQIDTITGWGFASHNRGRVKQLLDDLSRDPEAPVEKYGGRDAVRLTSIQDAKDYIKQHGGELPWGLRE